MKLHLSRKEFLDGLVVGGGMAGKSKVMNILECVKVEILDGKVRISSYDMESYASKDIDYVDMEGDACGFCIQRHDLVSAIKSLGDDIVVIDVDGITLTLKHAKGEMEFTCYSSSEFPALKKGAENVSVQVSSASLFRCLSDAKMFVCTDDLRKILCGVMLRVASGVLEIASTDGRKLYFNKIPCSYEGAEVCAVVPSSAMTPILSLLNGTEDATLSIGDTNVTVDVCDASLTARTIDGRYPNIHGVIPSAFSVIAEVDKNDIVSALKRSLIASDAANGRVVMNFNGVSVTVKSEYLEFGKKASETCLCSLSGGDLVVAVSGAGMLEAISTISGDTVVIKMMDETRPIVVVDKNDENKIALMMPMRID